MAAPERLRKNSQFASVCERRRTRPNDIVVLKRLPNTLEWNQYGFVVGKLLGGAVVRNGGKRLLREVARAIATKAGWDVVIIARSQTTTAYYHELGASVTALLHRARILADKEGARGIGSAGV
jgi:ribonuclease P protein component